MAIFMILSTETYTSVLCYLEKKIFYELILCKISQGHLSTQK